MSDVFKLSGDISIDVGQVAKDLQQIQAEGGTTEQALNQIDGTDISIDISQVVSDLEKVENNADQTDNSLKQIGDEGVTVDVASAVSDLEKLENNSNQTQDALKNIGDTKVKVKVEDAISDLGKVKSEADQVQDALKTAFTIEGVSAITDAFGSVVDSIMGMSEETLELAENQAKLSASCETTGHSASWMKDQYTNLYGYLGDDMAVTNSILNFEKLGLTQSETTSLIDSSIAVWTAYGDSIPMEGLAESIDETVKVGTATGSLCDALNWAGISEDGFNEKLAKCKTEQERAKLITETLNKTYGETKDKYDELSEGSRKYKEAQSDLEQSQTNLGQAMIPLSAVLTELKSKLIDAIIPAIENLSPILEGVVKVIDFLADKFTKLPEPIQTAITVVVGVAGALTALSAIIGLVSPIIGIFTNGWGLLVGAITKVASFVPTLIAAIGGISAPVLIVIGVITALIAIGVALYKNWDTVKAKAIEIWNAIKNTITSVVNGIKSTVSNVFNSVKSTVSNIFNSIKSTISSIWNSIKSTVSGACSNIYNSVSSKFNSVKSKISSTIESAKSIVSNGLNKIKGFFSNCKLSLPKIKLPHFSISGKLSVNPPSVPKFKVDWYKQGGVMTEPTIFGMNGSHLMAGGEAGDEAILPIDNFYDNLNKFLGERLSNNSTYNINFKFEDVKIQNEQDINKLAEAISERFQRMINRNNRMNGGVVCG